MSDTGIVDHGLQDAVLGPTGAPGSDATAEIARLKEDVLRARADFVNYQVRSMRDLARAEELALREYVTDMLPILDALDLAERVDGHVEALQLVTAALRQVLAVRGLERIEAVGRKFDPGRHEAVATKDGEPGVVLEELRAGYLWKGLLLRPAQVLVGKEAGA